MTRSSARVEPVDRMNLGACVDTLARAFVDNPASLALIPGDSATRRRVLGRVMRGFVEATLRAGTASSVAVDGRIAGAMLAFAPASYPLDLRSYAWLAFGPLSAGPRTAFRYALADRHLRRLHPHSRHWYLFVLGVDPEQQGRGLGSRMLDQLCASADRDRAACYLETDKESSVRLYQCHGFRVEHDETEPRLGLRFWTMSRPT